MKKIYFLGIISALFSTHAAPPTKITESNPNIQNFPHFQEELTKTFPNFFTYFGHWGKDCVNRMFPEILDRLELPQVEADGTVVFKNGYFSRIQEIADNYGATAYVAGGVVRSILSYIYQELYDAYKKSPKAWGNINRFTSPEEFFGQFVLEWKNKNPTLDPLDVLGIKSDIDILSVGCPPAQQSLLEDEIIEFMNGGEKEFKCPENASVFQKVIFPPADVQEYHQQIDRTTKQGGSTSDWMAFPLKRNFITRREGDCEVIREVPRTMREPEKINILGSLLGGKVNYVGNSRSTEKQTIRGLRVFLELPFLEPTQEGREALFKELNAIHGSLGQEAMDQVKKAIRNARFQGAGNRFSQKPWCELEVIQKNFPAYVPRIDLTQRADASPLASVSLLSMKDFIQSYTDNGVLYHGTPDIANLISMLRGGLVMSNDEAGTAAIFGAGFYTTKHLLTAQSYSDKEKGAVVTFKVDQNEKIRILDLNDNEHKKIYENKKASHRGKASFHDFLRDEHGIDIIVNGHVLILNEAVLEKDRLKEYIYVSKKILGKKLNLAVDQVVTLLGEGLSIACIESVGTIKDIQKNLGYLKKFLGELRGLGEECILRTFSDLKMLIEQNKFSSDEVYYENIKYIAHDQGSVQYIKDHVDTINEADLSDVLTFNESQISFARLLKKYTHLPVDYLFVKLMKVLPTKVTDFDLFLGELLGNVKLIKRGHENDLSAQRILEKLLESNATVWENIKSFSLNKNEHISLELLEMISKLTQEQIREINNWKQEKNFNNEQLEKILERLHGNKVNGRIEWEDLQATSEFALALFNADEALIHFLGLRGFPIKSASDLALSPNSLAIVRLLSESLACVGRPTKEDWEIFCNTQWSDQTIERLKTLAETKEIKENRMLRRVNVRDLSHLLFSTEWTDTPSMLEFLKDVTEEEFKALTALENFKISNKDTISSLLKTLRNTNEGDMKTQWNSLNSIKKQDDDA
jgi:hypothetical protein